MHAGDEHYMLIVSTLTSTTRTRHESGLFSVGFELAVELPQKLGDESVSLSLVQSGV